MKFGNLTNGLFRSKNESGVSNLVENPTPSLNTSGYVVSKNTTASAIPDSGFVTSGTNITWTRSTSDPLNDTASFLLTKDANNRLGEQVYYPFTVKRSKRTKPHTISFDYEIASGTYATGDVTIWIYDVTNNSFIQTSGYLLESTTVPSQITGCTFQPNSNSSSYRLIFHVSSTSALAYSIKIDDIEITPQVFPIGTAVTDWVSYTPSWTTSGTAPSLGNGSISGRWRRIGDSAEVEISLALGSTSTVGTGLQYVSLPPGIIRDTSKATNSSFAGGVVKFYDNGSSTNARVGTPQWWTSPQRVGGYMGGYGQLDASLTGYGGNGDQLVWTLRYPVVGWSSSVIMSSSADTRVVAASVYDNPNSSITSSFSTVTWAAGGEYIDTHNAFNRTTGIFTAPIPGYYRMDATFEVARSSGSSTQYLVAGVRNVTKNITLPLQRNNWLSAGSEGQGVGGSAIIYADAGDSLVFLAASQGSGMAWSAASIGNRISIERVSGPSQIAASEVIACRAISSGSSISGSESTVVYTSKSFDTHSAYNTSTGVFTAPAPGFYEISAGYLTVSHASSTTGAIQIGFRKNGGAFQRMGWTTGNGATTNFHVNGTDGIDLNAGDTVEIRSISTASTSIANGYVYIKRLGGVG